MSIESHGGWVGIELFVFLLFALSMFCLSGRGSGDALGDDRASSALRAAVVILCSVLPAHVGRHTSTSVTLDVREDFGGN